MRARYAVIFSKLEVCIKRNKIEILTVGQPETKPFDFDELRAHYNQLSQQFDKSLLAIPASESGEEFIYLPEVFYDYKLKARFAPQTLGMLFYLRKSVAHSLVDAIAHFNGLGLTPVIESAYRLPSFQQHRFQKRFLEMQEKYSDKTKEELLLLANTYTAGIPILAAHIAGAAVDVMLEDAGGTMLEFGCPYPHGDIESVTDYNFLPESIKENRNILKTGMESAGFSNYPFEYWHYSIGDVCSAYLRGEPSAVYLPVELDPITRIMSLFDNAESRSFFAIANQG